MIQREIRGQCSKEALNYPERVGNVEGKNRIVGLIITIKLKNRITSRNVKYWRWAEMNTLRRDRINKGADWI